MGGNVEQRISDLGIALPEPAAAVGSYVPYRIAGGLITVSGQLPWLDGKIAYPGRVGVEVSLDEGIAAARLCALSLVAQVRDACDGDLDRVSGVIRLGGFVNTAPGFVDHAKVINGASDVIAAIFGDAGRHARAAVGVASLPLNAPVEVEGLFKIR